MTSRLPPREIATNSPLPNLVILPKERQFTILILFPSPLTPVELYRGTHNLDTQIQIHSD